MRASQINGAQVMQAEKRRLRDASDDLAVEVRHFPLRLDLVPSTYAVGERDARVRARSVFAGANSEPCIPADSASIAALLRK